MNIRVGVIGPYACGKSTLIEKITAVAHFDWEKGLQMMAATYSPEVSVVKTGRVELLLIDTAGQERFKALNTSFLRGCDIVLSCQEAGRFLEGAKEYLQIGGDDVKELMSRVEYGQHHCQVITVLTKSDLCNLNDLVPFAEKHVVTSAYDRDSVIYLLKVLSETAEEVAASKESWPSFDTTRLKEKTEESSCC